jgi:mono/diheme cytochrome c family protein
VRTTPVITWLTVGLLGGVAFSAQLFAQASSFDTKSGEELYRTGCAACHGPDGTGMPRSTVGFDTPLPDFTDCTFATPEPASDWSAIIHRGGRARAFDRRMPAFGEVLSDAAIQKLIDHLRGFCTSRKWPRGDLNLPRALVTEKAFPENETVITAAIARGDEPSVVTDFTYERRLGTRSQLELVVPLELRGGGQGGWQRGLGDVAFALKQTLFHSLASGTIFTGGAELGVPTGKETSGFGKGVTVFEPFLALGQSLPSDGFFQMQTGMELPADSAKAGKEAFVRAAAGKSFISDRFGRAWSPMIEVLAAREVSDEEKTQWDLVPQMQVTLSKRQHISISAGLQIPMTDRRVRPKQLLTYFLWDWFDGGLFDGWR